ncbi:MAG: HAMP domain-containing sensor histidine kinase [Elusimicrobiota bacterium]|jgi:signal transduction histidine kinase
MDTGTFPPPELLARAPKPEIARCAALLQKITRTAEFIDPIPDLYMVLNQTRQIILANRRLRGLLKHDRAGIELGLRPGEAIGCIHAGENESGCGATSFCMYCGALRAILSGLMGNTDAQECRLTLKGTGEAMDLKVFTHPLSVEQERFTICVLQDISDQKRREALESTFLHDISNTATSIYGMSWLLQDGAEGQNREFASSVLRSARLLANEIKAQQELAAAEHKKLDVNPDKISAHELMKEVMSLYQGHDLSRGKTMALAPGSQDVEFQSDPTLITRVLGNMIKNALEASGSGDTVALSSAQENETVEFRVHNSKPMPETVKKQVFSRSFSTKGRGRGLGTYSMRLLSERYLQGKVSFETSPSAGTTFIARYPLRIERTR